MAKRKPKPSQPGQPEPPKQPLAEVFGFPIDNLSAEADRYRQHKLCPFNNKVPNCTKDKANDPLGVCSIHSGLDVVITCPVRFRQNWIIADDAASFFFPPKATWTSLTEVRLKDKHGGSAGNIDVVLVSYDDRGKVLDFGALEVQAVYISGNGRNPFAHYMENPHARTAMDWTGQEKYPNPDYLSSSRKRLAPQLIFKGGIIKAWGKKAVVALNAGFFNTLPTLEEVEPARADIAWMVYDLRHDATHNVYALERCKAVYTRFDTALSKITVSEPGNVQDFVTLLQNKLDEKLEGEPPDVSTLDALL